MTLHGIFVTLGLEILEYHLVYLHPLFKYMHTLHHTTLIVPNYDY